MLHGQLTSAFAALLQVILIDLVLAGDNAVVIGTAAGRLSKARRNKVVFWGMSLAVVLRIGLALIAASVLDILGLMLAGGLLLLWVAWRLYRDIVAHHAARRRQADGQEPALNPLDGTSAMRKAIFRIAIADISMSLDNVLAVAGAAMGHLWVLVVGLLLSIALTGVAATAIAALLRRHPSLNYAGLLIILYVAVRMIWQGALTVLHVIV
ncbi:MAG: YjbE family putative metal transport protein [Alphaproteobacteria bacterium]|nr:YjbE family putative metal transport protein [Alphaproteobacteria bacterium]